MKLTLVFSKAMMAYSDELLYMELDVKLYIKNPCMMLCLNKSKYRSSFYSHYCYQISHQLILRGHTHTHRYLDHQIISRSTKRLSTTISCNTWELIHQPVGSICYLLHYHGLSCTDWSLGPRDCDFPASQVPESKRLEKLWTKIFQNNRLMDSLFTFVPLRCSREEITPIWYLYPSPTDLQYLSAPLQCICNLI